MSCRTKRLYNEPAADAYSCYLSFLLYVYPPSLVLLYYSNIIFQAYCAKPRTLTRYCVFFVSFHRQRRARLTNDQLCEFVFLPIWIMLCNLEFLKGTRSFVFSQFLSQSWTFLVIFFLLQLLIDIKWKIVVLFIWQMILKIFVNFMYNLNMQSRTFYKNLF